MRSRVSVLDQIVIAAPVLIWVMGLALFGSRYVTLEFSARHEVVYWALAIPALILVGLLFLRVVLWGAGKAFEMVGRGGLRDQGESGDLAERNGRKVFSGGFARALLIQMTRFLLSWMIVGFGVFLFMFSIVRGMKG